MTNGEKRLSILGHLTELRKRLTRSVIAVVITTIIAFVFWRQIFDILVYPGGDINFIYTELTEGIGTIMRVCLISGVILAVPYLTYEFIMFVAPALTPKEKRYVYLILPWIALMFAGGVAFGYFILIPPAVEMLANILGGFATAQIRIGNYVSVVTRLLLAIGLVFEMPVVTTFLARLGVVSSQWLASKRKMAIILAFVLAAIITPTFDPINQSLVAIPLVLLYELSIWLARLVQKKKAEAV